MNRWKGKTLLMMAGGTGGHVYPALAVARAAREKGAVVHWLGNARGFEGDKVPKEGFTLHDIAVCAIRGKGWRGMLNAPFMLARALLASRRIIKALRPDVVIGMGGFASGPGGLAAKQLGIALLVHEQNAVAGLTNRKLSAFASKVLLADVRAAPGMAARSYVVTGNPVRQAISAVPEAAQRFLGRHGAIRLLVLGGSQGAKALNDLLPQALALLPEHERPEVIHQVGERWVKQTTAAYRHAGVKAQVAAFLDDMAQAYADCDWLIARSGALTVAEIATVGVSAVFVPFPHAVDDHQTANAQILADAGAAEIIQQADLTKERLAQVIAARKDRAVLCKQAERARAYSHAKALDKIMREIETLL